VLTLALAIRIVSKTSIEKQHNTTLVHLESWIWLDGRRVDFSETPPSVIAANNLIFPYQQQKPCGKVELLRPNESTVLFGLMQQECTKTERALCRISTYL
jgi:hypothetical protein